MELNNRLKNLTAYPFHMPGHKRNGKFSLPSYEIDITEIDGFDDLHNAKEILADLENEIADIFGYRKSIISVNGSTCCILSAISAAAENGSEIIIARNCHKSVYNACFINKLDIHYIEPEFDERFGMYGRITQNAVEKAIKENPDACAVVITSPTYEGIISNIKTNGIPLIIDSAHGAHFGFYKDLPKKQNADIVIQSLHKTLPALTQTAVIHCDNSDFDEKIQKYMDIFETSSPSYILLSSIEKCIEFLKNSNTDFEKYFKMLNEFYKEAKKIKSIEILENNDKTRIVIASKYHSGTELSQILRNRGIESECATVNYIILISTVADTQEGFEKLLNVLKGLDGLTAKERFIKKLSIPQKSCNPFEIKTTEKVALKECKNKISASYIFAYPPGIPIIIPGEIISCEILNYIEVLDQNGVNLVSDCKDFPESIRIKIQ